MHKTKHSDKMKTAVLSVAALSVAAVAPTVSGLAVTVFGGTGYVGSAVCERLIKKGHTVTAVSRRGQNPKPDNAELSQVGPRLPSNCEGNFSVSLTFGVPILRILQVNWVVGDATDPKTVDSALRSADAAVHAIGLLFDVDSGLTGLNKIVSGSGSLPGEDSTYDNITRKTAFNVINAIEKKQNFLSKNLSKKKFPFAFVSAAEAGWPEVAFGETVDGLAPEWLNKYLIAKRAVEAKLNVSKGMRPCIYRPSLIWDWTKFDVLPVIPVFNLAAAVGVPFVDKTVRVETLADAIVAGIENDDVEGVQRVTEMEALGKR